jgi:radical SAM protein with 4Fe4S-binding SPASM domain
MKPNQKLVVGWSYTKRCNLKCIHCYNSSGKCLPNEISLQDAKKIVDKLSEYGVWAVNFGGGECILREDFIDLCKYLKEKNIEISYTTNGTLFSVLEKHLDLFHDIGISIDFADAQKHDYFRGIPGTFDKAVKTIKELVKRNANVEIVTCLNKMNSSEEELSALFNLAKELGVEHWRLNRFRENGRGDLNSVQLSLTKEELKRAHTFLNSLGKEVHSPEPIFRAGHGAKYFVDGDPSGQTAFRIQPDGKVTPCVFLSEDAGNILNEPIEKIVNHPIFKRIRNRTPQGKCKSCKAYSHCQGGDAGASYVAHGHFNGPDPLCWVDPETACVKPEKSSSEECNVHELYLCTLYLEMFDKNYGGLKNAKV